MARNELKTLKQEINREIRNRVLDALGFVLLVLIGTTALEFTNSVESFENHLAQHAKDVEGVILSEVMVGNHESLPYLLEDYQKDQKFGSFEWQRGATKTGGGIRFKYPLSWIYIHPIRQIDSSSHGVLVFSGRVAEFLPSFLLLFQRLWVLIAFAVVTLLMLYPLSNKIPDMLIHSPIQKILELIRARDPGAVPVKPAFKEMDQIVREIVASLSERKQLEARNMEAEK